MSLFYYLSVARDDLRTFLRPSADDTATFRGFVPYVEYLGPAWFRRFLLQLVPNKKVQRVKTLVDQVHNRSKEIFCAKKAAVERGDTELIHTIGEGKDVMSILCA